MIPFWHDGHLIACSRPGQPIHLQHCPVCGDAGTVRAFRTVRIGRPGSVTASANHRVSSVGVLIGCPQCTDTADLWRVLDRRPA